MRNSMGSESNKRKGMGNDKENSMGNSTGNSTGNGMGVPKRRSKAKRPKVGNNAQCASANAQTAARQVTPPDFPKQCSQHKSALLSRICMRALSRPVISAFSRERLRLCPQIARGRAITFVRCAHATRQACHLGHTIPPRTARRKRHLLHDERSYRL